ncbi:MAG: glycosyltransferase family 4 protein [Nitrospiraceae bacterium]
MNIVHMNTLDTLGGAALAMHRLHEGLRQLGHQSHLLVGFQTTPDPEVDTIDKQARPFRTFTDKVVDRLATQLETRWGTNAWSHRNSFHIFETPAFKQADIIHLHNLHGGYFNFRALPEMARRKPMVWTLHDMWALTGHCAYSYDCERWRSGCYDCPLLKEPGRQYVEPPPISIDNTRSEWIAKQATYERTPAHIVAPSEWLRKLADQSLLDRPWTTHTISYGLDLELFHPLPSKAARMSMQLPDDKSILFFSADSVQNTRKGFSYLCEALNHLENPSSYLLLVSGHQPLPRLPAQRFQVRHVGFLKDTALQRLAFTAADVFLFPSLADNQPLSVIEALACGKPVVCFDVGGVPEMIQHMKTGYVARYKDTDDFARGIALIAKDQMLRTRMAERCRQAAESKHSLHRQTQRYVEVYAQAMRDKQINRHGLSKDGNKTLSAESRSRGRAMNS